jgi:catalase
MATQPSKPTTTDAGAPVASDEHSLTVGADGPIVLNDHYMIEQMANFNRERIPERQPHAKGGGAHGHFNVTNDVSGYTRAAVFQPGTKTDTLIRFSTVAGERGSPDTWRDPRGFALKFYASEGIYDMVGNNAPVYFIRSQKRRADNGLRDHDMQWDFWSLFTLRNEDDDFGQAGTMVRHVLADAARARLVSNIVGHLKDGVFEPVLARTLEYWHKVDKDLGERIAAGMKVR